MDGPAPHSTKESLDRPFRRFVRDAAGERRRILDQALRQARRNPSPEAVHDVRVAIRRLLTVFAICPASFGAGPVRKARKRLKRIMRRAGAVRDRDIALELLAADTAQPLGPEDSLEAAEFRDRLSSERGEAARRFRRAVRKSRRRAVRAGVRAAVASKPCSSSEPDGWDPVRPAAENARLRLPGMAAELFDLGRQSAAPDAALAGLHRLRLAVKRLRYTLELFRSFYADRLQRHLAALRGLQDRLGAINDLGLGGLLGDPVRAGEPAAGARRAAIAGFDRHWREEFDQPGERERWMLELATPIDGATGRRPAA